MFATLKDFHLACNIRDWYYKRLNRYLNGKRYATEYLEDVLRAAQYHDALTRILGDGAFVNYPPAKLKPLQGLGYKQDRG